MGLPVPGARQVWKHHRFLPLADTELQSGEALSGQDAERFERLKGSTSNLLDLWGQRLGRPPSKPDFCNRAIFDTTHQLLVFFRYWLFRPQRSGGIEVDGPPQGKECGEQRDEAQENSG